MINDLSSEQMGQQITEFVTQKIQKRRIFERRWYDNNFFDDGFHFRSISKKTGRVIDKLTGGKGYTERAIPRASLQIRGVSNLLFAAEPYPVIYPQRVTIETFRDPSTGQINEQAYKLAYDRSKQEARKRGTWLTTEWEDQEMLIKTIEALISAAKESVSYIQVMSDTDEQKIVVKVRGAFEVVLDGDLKSVQEQSQIAIVEPMTLDEIKSNELFDPEMTKKLTPDNKYATSEVRDAYMRAKFGSKTGEKGQGTLLVIESFRKEYLSDENSARAIRLSKESGALEGKDKGDMIMRHTFAAGGVTLFDEYINYDQYPLAEFRFEPGSLYSTPLIERFIPQNKSLDIIMTRLEKWVNTMVIGAFQKRKGEDFQVSNMPGGQLLEYETTPLTQLQTSSVGSTPFNVIQLLDKYIEEQGATTSALGQASPGVKSGVAIESLKASEYANLKIPGLMLKSSLKKVAELMFERAHKDFLKPVEVEHIQDSEPSYFDVVGKRGFDLANQVGKQMDPNTIVLDKDVKIRIEMEPGLGLTMQGRRESMQNIITFMIQLSTGGMIDKEPLKIVIKKFLDTYGFGSTEEFMEAFSENAPDNMTEDNITKMKIAVVEVLKELELVGPEADQKLVDSTKVGVIEAMQQSGLAKSIQNINAPKPVDTAKVSESVSFKDLPINGKIQMAAKAGIVLQPADFATTPVMPVKQSVDNTL